MFGYLLLRVEAILGSPSGSLLRRGSARHGCRARPHLCCVGIRDRRTPFVSTRDDVEQWSIPHPLEMFSLLWFTLRPGCSTCGVLVGRRGESKTKKGVEALGHFLGWDGQSKDGGAGVHPIWL